MGRKKKNKTKIHYIYKIHFLCGFPTSRYYIGRRSYKGNDLAKDTYAGSGTFCKAYFKKYGRKEGITYIKEILEINPSLKINIEREEFWVGDLWKTDPLCKNEMPGGDAANPYTMRDMVNKSIEKSSKPVLCYDKDGKFIKKYDSVASAAEEVEGKGSNISRCCNKVRGYKILYGYIWRWESNPLQMSELKTLYNYKTTRVLQFDLSGKHIKTFNSIAEASKEVGAEHSKISLVCQRKRQTSKGFIWRYDGDIVTLDDLVKLNPFKVKPVYKLDLNGNILEKFDNLKAAERSVHGDRRNIQKCIEGEREEAYGYKWKYVNDN